MLVTVSGFNSGAIKPLPSWLKIDLNEHGDLKKVTTVNTSFTDDINTMRREIVHKHNSALLPEIPIMGSDFLKLLESIQSKETAIVVEGYGTINVALSLSFDRKSVYKINKQYLRDSFRSNLLRNTDDIKRELVEAMKIDQSGNTVHILRQGKVRVLKKECLGDMQRYFMFLMKCMASKKQIIGDYKNIDNFGVMHGKVKIIDADLLVDLSEDNPSLELMGLCDMVVNDFLTYMMTTEKYQEENDEMDLMHLILGLSQYCAVVKRYAGSGSVITKKSPVLHGVTVSCICVFTRVLAN